MDVNKKKKNISSDEFGPATNRIKFKGGKTKRDPRFHSFGYDLDRCTPQASGHCHRTKASHDSQHTHASREITERVNEKENRLRYCPTMTDCGPISTRTLSRGWGLSCEGVSCCLWQRRTGRGALLGIACGPGGHGARRSGTTGEEAVLASNDIEHGTGDGSHLSPPSQQRACRFRCQGRPHEGAVSPPGCRRATPGKVIATPGERASAAGQRCATTATKLPPYNAWKSRPFYSCSYLQVQTNA